MGLGDYRNEGWGEKTSYGGGWSLGWALVTMVSSLSAVAFSAGLAGVLLLAGAWQLLLMRREVGVFRLRIAAASSATDLASRLTPEAVAITWQGKGAVRRCEVCPSRSRANFVLNHAD